MGMYTWLSDNEFEKFTQVSDPELNKVFQEVRELMPQVFIDELFYERKRWFGKNKKEVYYFVYTITSRPEVRCINLNFSSSAHVFNYLCGLFNGYRSVAAESTSVRRNDDDQG